MNISSIFFFFLFFYIIIKWRAAFSINSYRCPFMVAIQMHFKIADSHSSVQRESFSFKAKQIKTKKKRKNAIININVINKKYRYGIAPSLFSAIINEQPFLYVYILNPQQQIIKINSYMKMVQILSQLNRLSFV